MTPLRIAIPKGRLQKPALAVFENAGCVIPSERELSSRRLVFHCGATEWIFVKDGDVPVYVAHGAADAGVAGLDQIEERAPFLEQPVELGFGVCRMMLIAAPGAPQLTRLSRGTVATKYPAITRRFLQQRGIGMDVVALQGSVELAAVLRLTPFIVDLVETGETARIHDLEMRETIFEVSPRVVVSPTAWAIRSELRELIDAVRLSSTPRLTEAAEPLVLSPRS